MASDADIAKKDHLWMGTPENGADITIIIRKQSMRTGPFSGYLVFNLLADALSIHNY